jgi:hypothetical protein
VQKNRSKITTLKEIMTSKNYSNLGIEEKKYGVKTARRIYYPKYRKNDRKTV